MERFEVAIVGGGPAGLACARDLAANGRRVVVIEAQPVIGPKICAGGITWAGLQDGIPASLAERRFAVQHVHTPWQTVRLEAGHPLVVTMSRARLGEWMAQQAKAAGAEIISNCRVEEIEPERLHTDQGKIGCRFLVGADGSKSLVRRFLGLDRRSPGGGRPKGIGLGVQYWLQGVWPRMEWHLVPRRFGHGYGWIFPHGDRCSVGAYAGWPISGRRLARALNQWLGDLGVAEARKNLRQEAFPIRYDFRGWRFGAVFLAGDAAGLASALTGEGIHPAIVSGRAIAATILGQNGERLLAPLLARHRKHRRYQRLAALGPLATRLLGEGLLLALRSRLATFSTLEMTGKR
ncbi:MAG TPA: NAD(P)/FAD-dependent oxidoreductase [Desulfobacterales bacterium]|nr:NAD(P)/FAD-dependent oxidoreductase [Desulfobacterales bacterium]